MHPARVIQATVQAVEPLTHDLKRRHPAFKRHVVVASGGDPRKPRGGLVAEAIAQNPGRLDDWRTDGCGSPPRVDAASALARRKVIDAARLYAEAFHTQAT